MSTPVLPETPPVGGSRATVTGHIVDASGAAVAGAALAVRATGESATTDSNGAFVLDVPADTTLTLQATAPTMATTLLAQFVIAAGASTSFEIPLLGTDHVKSLIAQGAKPSGGAIAIAARSQSGAADSAAGATVELTPSNLGKVLYAPKLDGMPDPDPGLTSVVPGTGPIAWALGVQPHVSIMKLTLRGVSQLEPPYSIDGVTWPGTFTVDAGALTLVTLFTP